MWRRVTGVTAVALGVALTRFAVLLSRGRRVARTGRRFVRRRRSAPRVLIVGDSSAVGVGASVPHRSAAGFLAERWPEFAIGNLAMSGSRTADVARLLRRLGRRVHRVRYAVVIIHTGGNDILRFTNLEVLRRQLRKTIDEALHVAAHVVIVTGGNLALAPAAFFPMNLLWGSRCRTVRGLFADEIAHHDATFVDLFRERAVDPTSHDPRRYFAADGLHPSDANYELWADAIVDALAPRNVGRV